MIAASYACILAASINKAMSVSMKHQGGVTMPTVSTVSTTSIDGKQNTVDSIEAKEVVFKIAVVQGRPFYGYAVGEEVYLKVYLYDPSLVSRVTNLLRAGAVMGCRFQPFEVLHSLILTYTNS